MNGKHNSKFISGDFISIFFFAVLWILQCKSVLWLWPVYMYRFTLLLCLHFCTTRFKNCDSNKSNAQAYFPLNWIFACHIRTHALFVNIKAAAITFSIQTKNWREHVAILSVCVRRTNGKSFIEVIFWIILFFCNGIQKLEKKHVFRSLFSRLSNISIFLTSNNSKSVRNVSNEYFHNGITFEKRESKIKLLWRHVRKA